jgi:hypothetical protein
MTTANKVLKAQKQTEKIKLVQEEHEKTEKERMEKVFADYV